MKDVRTILLILLSLLLLGTWAFHIYDKSKYAAVPASTVPAAIKNETQLNDSIQLLYKTTVAQLETVIVGKDSINKELQQKASAIDTLRNEISRILNETNLTKEDLKKALMKIQELQLKVNQYNNRSSSTVASNSPAIQSAPIPVTSKTQVNPVVAEPIFQSNDVNMQAVKTKDGDTDAHFNISFQLKNTNAATGTASIYLIIKDPSGNTIQDDEWIAGVFTSKTEGTKKYSRKLNWDFSRNDARRFTSTVPVKTFVDGSYQLQVYCNGVRVGKADLVLN
jgi:hypothetical protein